MNKVHYLNTVYQQKTPKSILILERIRELNAEYDAFHVHLAIEEITCGSIPYGLVGKKLIQHLNNLFFSYGADLVLFCYENPEIIILDWGIEEYYDSSLFE